MLVERAGRSQNRQRFIGSAELINLREVCAWNYDRLRSVRVRVAIEQPRLVGVVDSLVIIGVRGQEL
jgi:hypothetical protein